MTNPEIHNHQLYKSRGLTIAIAIEAVEGPVQGPARCYCTLLGSWYSISAVFLYFWTAQRPETLYQASITYCIYRDVCGLFDAVHRTQSSWLFICAGLERASHLSSALLDTVHYEYSKCFRFSPPNALSERFQSKERFQGTVSGDVP